MRGTCQRKEMKHGESEALELNGFLLSEAYCALLLKHFIPKKVTSHLLLGIQQ